MKKIILALLLIIPFASFAQDNPTPEQLNSYIGKDVMITPVDHGELLGYMSFVKDHVSPHSFETFMPKSPGNSVSDYKALVNQVFKVTALFKDDNTLYIELKNPKLGKCYYAYNTTVDLPIPLKLVADMKYAPGSICNSIIVDKDKFTDEVTSRTGIGRPVVVSKHEKDGATYYTVLVSTSSLSTDLGNGVSILLDDKTQISRDIETNVEYLNGDGYNHYAVFRLEDDEVQRLKGHAVTDVRVYNYDRHIPTSDSDNLKQLINCLTDTK